jgi:2-hydroxyglutarate dehydrogenase
LCIRGRDLLYKRCSAAGIAHRKTGKLILANSPNQVEYLEGLRKKAGKIEALGEGRVPLQWLSGDEVREREPDVSKGVVGALLSPETGIVSSHELMEDLEKSECSSLSALLAPS